MREKNERIVCPHCNYEYIRNYSSFEIYYVKQLEGEYKRTECPSCDNSFWYNGQKSAEILDDDEFELVQSGRF